MRFLAALVATAVVVAPLGTATAQSLFTVAREALYAPTLVDGTLLHALCKQGGHDYNESNCYGFVAGVMETTSINIRAGHEAAICVPDRVSLTQMVDVVAAYVSKNATARHLSAAYLATEAMREAFPC